MCKEAPVQKNTKGNFEFRNSATGKYIFFHLKQIFNGQERKLQKFA